MLIVNQGGRTQKQCHSLSPLPNASHEEEGLYTCYVLNVSPQNSYAGALNPDVMESVRVFVCVSVFSVVSDSLQPHGL